MRALAVALLATLLGVAGCPSAYQSTYDQELQRLESEQRAQQAAEEKALAQARKYAAVVYFELGSAVVDADGQRELTWFVQQLEPYPKTIILVQGFADATGGEARNQTLSKERAANAAQVLESQGIDGARIRTEGFASAYPADPNETAHGRSRNRRVEVTVQ